LTVRNAVLGMLLIAGLICGHRITVILITEV